MSFSQTPEYKTWDGMKRRCYNLNHEKYAHYGGRGIIICERWLGVDGFKNFLLDMGRKPAGLTIDRRDPNGHYTPDNCRWATKQEQENNKTNNTRIEFNGVTMTIAEWARHLGIKKNTLVARIVTYKMPLKKALVSNILKTGPK